MERVNHCLPDPRIHEPSKTINISRKERIRVSIVPQQLVTTDGNQLMNYAQLIGSETTDSSLRGTGDH